MNILVTGGAGFIGSHLTDALIDKKHQIFVLDDLSTGNIQNLNKKANFINVSINYPDLKYAFDTCRFDYVFHLAAQINLRHSIKEPLKDAETNIIGSLNIIENCIRHKVKKIIFSSTGGAIYSPSAPLPWNEESEAKPESPYAQSKKCVEDYLQIFKKIHELPSTILRYSNVYGPRQNSKGEAGVISIFIEKALKNENLTIFGDGQQTRDFIYVDDVVQANLLALESNIEGIYNVSTNSRYSVNQIANKILQNITTSSKIVYDKAVLGEIAHTQLCSDKLIKEEWSPKWDIDRGMKTTIDYFKLYGST